MKKLICSVLALIMVLSFAGCAGNEEGSTPSENKVDTPSSGNAPVVAEGYVFNYKGTKIPVNENFAPILKALGDPKSYDEKPSCAFNGKDKTYFYGSFYVATYPDGDNDYVSSVWFVDDSVATDEGITIGSAKADVEKAYGADGFNGTNAYIMTKGSSRLTIIMKDDVVSSIQYDAVTK